MLVTRLIVHLTSNFALEILLWLVQKWPKKWEVAGGIVFSKKVRNTLLDLLIFFFFFRLLRFLQFFFHLDFLVPPDSLRMGCPAGFWQDSKNWPLYPGSDTCCLCDLGSSYTCLSLHKISIKRAIIITYVKDIMSVYNSYSIPSSYLY